MSLCPSKRLYVCPSIFNMYKLLLTYCYSTKNLRNLAFVCVFKGIFVVKYKWINCRITGGINLITGTLLWSYSFSLALPMYVKNVVGYSPVRGRMYMQVKNNTSHNFFTLNWIIYNKDHLAFFRSKFFLNSSNFYFTVNCTRSKKICTSFF